MTAISITRLTYLIGFFGNWAKSTNTQGLYNAAVWTTVEITTGIIVACLPASRIIVTKYVIKVLDSTGLSKSSRKSQLPSSSPENSNRPSRRGSGRASGMLTSKFWLPVTRSTATTANDTRLESTRHVHDADGESNMELVSVRSHAANDADAAAEDLSRRPSQQLGEKRQTCENV